METKESWSSKRCRSRFWRGLMKPLVKACKSCFKPATIETQFHDQKTIALEKQQQDVIDSISKVNQLAPKPEKQEGNVEIKGDDEDGGVILATLFYGNGDQGNHSNSMRFSKERKSSSSRSTRLWEWHRVHINAYHKTDSHLITKNKARVHVAETFPVFLNVYDIHPISQFTYKLGLGIHHSGVQVHGMEYTFGADENEDPTTTGIYEMEPKGCKEFSFRKAIVIGWTDLVPEQVSEMMEELSAVEYKSGAYNLFTKNCNHFSNHICVRLTGNPIPSWVNRAARLALCCKCVIPGV